MLDPIALANGDIGVRMNFVLQPWQLLVVILTGWLNRRQQAVIDFLLTEVLVLKESNGKRRILLSDEQRRRLAIKGKALGRKAVQPKNSADGKYCGALGTASVLIADFERGEN